MFKKIFESLAASWLPLLLASLVLVLPMEWLRLPAAPMLGCIGAGVVIALYGRTPHVPRPFFAIAQGIIGCLIARSVQPATLLEVAHAWPVFLAAVLAVILASAGLGWVLMRRRVLPGPTVVWGLSPGAATVMTLMAESYGADTRLVAFMQFLRVVVVTAAASLVARFWIGDVPHSPSQLAWLGPVAWGDLAGTLAIVLAGAWLATRVKLPAGPLLLGLGLGIPLQGLGVLHIELPPLLLLASYAAIGWSIGLRFTRPIIEHALHALPQVLLSILALILVCVGFAALLTHFAGIDPLTAYLATSPGGADSVAIIAASSQVDLPFVMAMQTARFLLVLAIGPWLARTVTLRAGRVREAP